MTDLNEEGTMTMDDNDGEKRKRRWVMPATVIAVLLLLAFGLQRFAYARVHESTNDAFVGGRMVPVLAKVGGFVDEVRIEENQHVDAGQLLVILGETEFEQDVQQAEAELAGARSAVGSAGTVGEAVARLEQARRERAALTARIDAARANASRAERDLERTRTLTDKEILSHQQLDASVAAAEEARATVVSLEEQRSAAEAGIATAEAVLRRARARLKGAEVALERARLQRSYAHITAPVSGQISRRSVEPGQLLQPGQALFTVVADSGMFVTANFKETQLAELRRGDPVQMEVDAYGGCTAHGEVESISGATGSQFALIPPDNATGNFTKVVQRVPVRIALKRGCGPDRPLRPGMSIVVHVQTG